MMDDDVGALVGQPFAMASARPAVNPVTQALFLYQFDAALSESCEVQIHETCGHSPLPGKDFSPIRVSEPQSSRYE
jgi:hypothetical protein